MTRIQIHPRKKQKIFERDNFKCLNCGATGDFNSLEVDHIISVIDGGTNDENNLQTLCYKCNMNKYYKKEVTDNHYLNLTPLERLELIKKSIEQYKELTLAEFKVIYTQDYLFKRLRINFMDVQDLFIEQTGYIKHKIRNSEKNKTSRDRLIAYLYKKGQITQEQIAEIANLDRGTVADILKRYKNDKKETD